MKKGFHISDGCELWGGEQLLGDTQGERFAQVGHAQCGKPAIYRWSQRNSWKCSVGRRKYVPTLQAITHQKASKLLQDEAAVDRQREVLGYLAWLVIHRKQRWSRQFLCLTHLLLGSALPFVAITHPLLSICTFPPRVNISVSFCTTLRSCRSTRTGKIWKNIVRVERVFSILDPRIFFQRRYIERPCPIG